MRKSVLSLWLACSLLAAAVTGFAATGPQPGLTDLELLGKKLFFDANLSTPKFQSCAVCHLPAVGWTGPDMFINARGGVYEGAVPGRFGNRKPPSAAYATLSPKFHYDMVEEIFVGGNFWDGRATGEEFLNPAHEQALGPFLNPVEQNNPSKWAVVGKVCMSQYADLYKTEFMARYPKMNPCMEKNVDKAYNFIGEAIAFYEDSAEVNQFSSKWDYYKKGMAELSTLEKRGMMLFFGPNDNDGYLGSNEGAGCSACHPDGNFTDFTYDNIGTPKNPENPFYRMDKVYLKDGSPINPEGKKWVDPGLGGFLKTRPEWRMFADDNMGKHKVPTMRNVDGRTHPGFVKAFGHNGFFKSLKGLVHFYNTRDVKDVCPEGKSYDPTDDYTEAMALKYNCWPAPEVRSNLNMDELGDLGLKKEDEWALVAFMQTLSDGYMDPPDGADFYDAYCMGCHGSPDPANMYPAPVAPRKVVGARSCSIKGAIYGTYVFKKGVPAMQFMKGAFTDQQIKMISEYLNSFDGITGQQRFVTTCAGCHGIDAMGGRVDEEVWGEDAYEIKEAIYDEDPMRFLKCLTGDDVYMIGDYLSGYGYHEDDDSSDDRDTEESKKRSDD